MDWNTLTNNILRFDYCNDISSAWIVIKENNIVLDPSGAAWILKEDAGLDVAQSYSEGIKLIESNENPLRAAMIVFLKHRL
jgi:hypothetical protein